MARDNPDPFVFPLREANEKESSPLREIGKNVKETATTIGVEPWKLEASITYPPTVDGGQLPAVVLVQGSGPMDRNETVGVQQPFRDIAMGLSERGIVVLRYDKKTYSYPKQIAAMNPPLMTPQFEVIDDALYAIEHLSKHENVDPNSIFLIGHSLGGYLAPEIMRQSGRLRGCILLAPNALSLLEEVLQEQVREQLTQDGNLSERDKKKLFALEKQVSRIMSGESKDTETLLGAPAVYWRKLREIGGPKSALLGEWPILIIHAGRDEQVNVINFEKWKKELEYRPNCSFKLYPKGPRINNLNKL